MKIQQKSTLKTFITIAATRWTCVRPMPSKNALMAMVMAIEITPRRRQREYVMATSRTSGTGMMNPRSFGTQRMPRTDKNAPATRQKNAAFARTAPA